MDTISALAMAEANRGKELMVFDWDKAANIIKEKRPLSSKCWTSG